MEKFLAILNSDAATGLDSFRSCVLKICSAALEYPLSALFTLSFIQGNLPSTWMLHKHAKTNPLNYRPISFCSIISNVMESIIKVDKILPFFFNGPISYQFRFRPGHSTLDMLLLLAQQLMEANIRHVIGAISPDISRAFKFNNLARRPALETL